MRKIKIIILTISTLFIIYINIKSVINNLLNKKYVVEEITERNTEKGLKGIYKIIDSDYSSFRWIILINTIYIVFMFSYIVYTNYKNQSNNDLV